MGYITTREKLSIYTHLQLNEQSKSVDMHYKVPKIFLKKKVPNIFNNQAQENHKIYRSTHFNPNEIYNHTLEYDV